MKQWIFAIGVLLAGFVHASPADVPLTPGMTFVIAVSNAASSSPSPAQTGEHVAQGDYEMLVTVVAADEKGIGETAFVDGVDEHGTKRQANISRLVLAQDLESARLQILGFHTSDPRILNGSTSLGPSRLVTRELAEKGSAAYSFRNFASRETVTGTLTRGVPPTVAFPVLVNGRRVILNAIRATGQMSVRGATRPFEHYILDDPRHPISLRIAYGPRGGGFPVKADFAREIVRIDFPVGQAPSLDEALAKNCRVEVPGVYFDFDKATLKPQSKQALQDIAAAIRKQPLRGLRIEGHTDNIGGDAYNDDLSARRAAAVKTALELDHGAAVGAHLSTRGFGARRPLETNATLAGRARNRRVELVRECGESNRRG